MALQTKRKWWDCLWESSRFMAKCFLIEWCTTSRCALGSCWCFPSPHLHHHCYRLCWMRYSMPLHWIWSWWNGRPVLPFATTAWLCTSSEVGSSHSKVCSIYHLPSGSSRRTGRWCSERGIAWPYRSTFSIPSLLFHTASSRHCSPYHT